MADTPFGLAPVRTANGSPWNGQAHCYFIPSTDGNAYAIGDPVTMAGSADPSGRAATVVLATAGGTTNGILGPIVGHGAAVFGAAIGANPSTLDTTVIPATKTRGYYVLVADDPGTIFEMQEDSVGNNLAITEVGLNIQLVAGTNNGYISGWELDSSVTAVTATHQMRLLGLSPRANNAIGANAKWLVKINLHTLGNASLGL